jgi:hypothetical protein
LRLGIFLALLTIILANPAFARPPEHSPQFLLTPQRLKRLKRDRDRQTPRWINFEERVKNVPDSPERGFELALYYAITNDETQGKKAIEWAKAHSCDERQVALVRDWVSGSPKESNWSSQACPGSKTGHLTVLRNSLFAHAADSQTDGKKLIETLQTTDLADASEVYAAIEYLAVTKTTDHADLRENAPQFFNSLPIQFLLNLKPAQVELPDWMTHIAALALISLDPNSDSSQFLQGWAIEDRQMVREGPGVAYELLWADPYLPGVGYQNLDPWWYDQVSGRLLARTNWEPNACWIKITTKGVEQQNCPANWQTQTVNFGHLQLTPMTQPCVEVQRTAPNITTLLWKLKPNGKLKYTEEKKSMTVGADTSGFWRVPANVEGKVCAAR